MRILTNKPQLNLIDPSELLRPEPKFTEKDVDAFRDFSINLDDPIQERVRLTYIDMHTNQTVDFVKGKHEKWCGFNTFKSTMKDVLIRLNELVDESDPDVDIPNIVHAFQTAERIRQDYPNDDWFHLTGLIHDAGKGVLRQLVILDSDCSLSTREDLQVKVMAFYDEPQWCVVGDTFLVGADWAPSIVYRDTSFENNPDGKNPKYNTKYGMYQPNCGLDNLLISWGHDEYLYRMLKHNKAKLPEPALKMIRFHSFYPWHTGGDYGHFMTEKDQTETKNWVLIFNQYDLYTKSSNIPDIASLWPYYEGLIEKYIPGELEW